MSSIKSLIIPLRLYDLSDKLAVFVTLNHVESWVEWLQVRFTALTNESFEGEFIAIHSGHAKIAILNLPLRVNEYQHPFGKLGLPPCGAVIECPLTSSQNDLSLAFVVVEIHLIASFAVYEKSSIEKAPACTQESNGYS